jgi:uncharacterized protein
MNQSLLIEHTIEYVKAELKDAEGGHDWWHIYRVWQNAKLIIQGEEADPLVVELAALLHDIADPKFHNGDESIGPMMAMAHLESLKVPQETIDHVVKIIENMSFKNSIEGVAFNSKEMQIVQDADRLDAIGAIGIARAFNYGGYKNRALYDPKIPPELQMTKEQYKKSTAPTINHFYEKLLLLKDKMNTATGKKIAEDRHIFMTKYLEQFYHEWNGDR